MADRIQRHNASAETGVVPNPDPALDTAHEHQHGHLHHSEFAGSHNGGGNVVYSTGTTAERSAVPDANPMDNSRHARGHPERENLSEKDEYDLKDAEKGAGSISRRDTDDTDSQKTGGGTRFYRRYKIYIHLFIWLFFTGWWIAGLVLHVHDKNWLIPFLLWLCISLRITTLYIPISVVTKPMHWAWNNTGVRVSEMIPEKMRIPAGAALVVVVFLLGAFVSKETVDNTRANRAVSLFGLVVFIAVLWATSANRKAIKWHTVIVGMLIQFIVALFVLRTKAGYDIFSFVSELARDLLGFNALGVSFLTDDSVPKLPWFFTAVIPPIIFFVSFVQLLYYWGILQWFIGKFAVFFFWALKVSGAEAVVAAASPFIGQGESAMLIRPFVAHLTKAEIHQIMCSGFATIAGSVLVGYIKLGVNPQALISSCVMSIPASLAISKLRYPETEETLTAGRVVIPDDDEHRAVNALHAFANGAWLGLKIAGMIVATLLCILSLLGLANGLLTWWGRYINIDGEYDLTVELLAGYICYPIAFLLGVSREGDDILKVGRLIGIKLIANEFVAYADMQTKPEYADLSDRSRLIATYALCGFANIGSLGTQIGVLSQISPGRSGDVSRMAVSALLTGAIATLTSASIAGLLIQDEAAFSSPAAGA